MPNMFDYEGTGKCAFCGSSTVNPLTCNDCWGSIVIANVTTTEVFGGKISYTEILELVKCK